MSLSTINIAPIEHYLRAMTAAEATDLMLTAHTQPRMRVDGRLGPIDGQPVLTPDDMRQAIAALLTTELHAELYEKKEVDFSFSYRDTHRFRGNCFIQQGIVALSLRSIPLDDPDVRRAAACRRRLRALLQPAAGPRARDRADRLGQVDDARVDDRLHQRATGRCHILTIEDPIEYVHTHKVGGREPARGRHRHRHVRTARCGLHFAKTPTSSSSVRCVTPRRSSSR